MKLATAVVAQMLTEVEHPITLDESSANVESIKKSSHMRPLIVPRLDFSLARMSCLQMWTEQEVSKVLFIYTMYCLGAHMLHWQGHICCGA